MAVPHPLEQAIDPAARQEALDRYFDLPDGALVNQVREQKRIAWQATQGLRRQWDAWWDLWLNQVGFPNKEEWQAKIWIAKPFAAVEQATALIYRALVDQPDFFMMTGQDKMDQLRADHIWWPLLKRISTECHFVERYVDACKVGFITGVAGYLKLSVRDSWVPTLRGLTLDAMTGSPVPEFANERQSALALDWVDPRSIWRDPDSRPRENFSGSYLYHSQWVPRTFLGQMIGRGWSPQATQTALASAPSAATQPIGTSAWTEYDQDRYDMLRSSMTGKLRSIYLVNEGWADVLDENGDLLLPDGLFIECNGQVVYRGENPLWAHDTTTGRRKWPLIAATPISHPKRFEGRGILESDEHLSWMYSNTFMLMSDGMNWLVNQPTEVWQDALLDWDELSHYPGKLWVKRSQQQALMPAKVGSLDLSASLAFLQYIDQVRQNTNFVTDFAIGLPGSRSDITKGEVQIKTAQSMAIFEAMARNLELLAREYFELTYQMSLQYMMSAPSRPNVARILGSPVAAQLSQMSVVERMDAVRGNWDFTFASVSQSIQRDSLMQRLLQFGELMARPPFMQILLQTGQVGVFMQLLASAKDILGLGDRIVIQEPPPVPVMPPQPGGPGPVGGPMAPNPGQPGGPPGPGASTGPEGSAVHPVAEEEAQQGYVNPAMAAGFAG